MPFCPNCGKYSTAGNFCCYCAAALTTPRPPHAAQQRSSGSGVAAAVILLLLAVGAFLFFAQQYGAGTNPLACFPHQETVYVGYVQTATQTFQITQGQKITRVSYDKGLLLYTVYLTNDQGQQFQYHYATAFNLTPTTIVTGC